MDDAKTVFLDTPNIEKVVSTFQGLNVQYDFDRFSLASVTTHKSVEDIYDTT